ncbi:MAG: hypothetical protein MZV64_19710 [Ignavibacteriales bacterium]|nr:hypothetical protein [Ignavibacteriales bacterium]
MVAPGREGAALAHFPRPFDVHGSAGIELREGFGDHLAAGQLFRAVFEDNGGDVRVRAGSRR